MSTTEPVRLNPFPGLRSYETQDAPWFFGRRTDIEGLQRRVETAGFVAVVGASGSGKSSMVKAGLVPLLGAADHGAWTSASFRPGSDPIGEMAAALARAAGEPTSSAKRAIETTLRRSSLGLIEAVGSLKRALTARVLVVVDQFDEVFRFKELTRVHDNGDEAVAFVNLLIEASREADKTACIIVTMRSDFLGRCEEFRGLPEVVSDGMYLIPRLTRSGMRAAIEGPIARIGAEISPRLVQRLLNDVDDAPDQLPVLQHVLMRTWERLRESSDTGAMDLEAYEHIGGMREALSRHADSVLETLADDAQREIAQTMFKRLTERGREGNETRRPTAAGEISAVAGADLSSVAAVLEHFQAPGCTLIIAPPPAELAADSVIDISHESLIRLWARLRVWIAEEADAAEHYIRVAEAARRHRDGHQSLYRDPELSAAISLFTRINEPWARRYHPDFQLAAQFLERSRDERDRVWAAARVEDVETPTVVRSSADQWDLWGRLRGRYQALARAGGPYKMLSIDGGGVRSLISIEVLARMESLLKARSSESAFRLCHYFDVIGGTSTGAIIAAALARGAAVDEVREYYRSMIPQMFTRANIVARLKYRYSAEPLGQALKQFFGDRTDLSPEHLKTLLLVITKNATTGSAWPVMSNPWAKYNDPARVDCNLRLPLWQLVRASTAAPAYFPPETIQFDPNNPASRFVISDGGLTPYNNPAFLMARMVTEPAYRLAWPSGESKLLLVSVGTGTTPTGGATAESPQEDMLSAGLNALSGVLSTVQTDQDLSCRTVGRCSFGDSIDREVGDLVPRNDSGAPVPLSTDTGRAFLYARYDAVLTTYGLSDLGLKDVDPSAIQRMDTVDSLDGLTRVGRALAERVSLDHLGPFVR